MCAYGFIDDESGIMKPMTEEDMLELIQNRWAQAHRHQSSADWDELIRLLQDLRLQVIKRLDHALANEFYFLMEIADRFSVDLKLRRAA